MILTARRNKIDVERQIESLTGHLLPGLVEREEPGICSRDVAILRSKRGGDGFNGNNQFRRGRVRGVGETGASVNACTKKRCLKDFQR
jgi:hypothetical protein